MPRSPSTTLYGRDWIRQQPHNLSRMGWTKSFWCDCTIYLGRDWNGLPSVITHFPMMRLIRPQQRGWTWSPQGNSPITFQGWDELDLHNAIAQFTVQGINFIFLMRLHNLPWKRLTWSPQCDCIFSKDKIDKASATGIDVILGASRQYVKNSFRRIKIYL